MLKLAIVLILLVSATFVAFGLRYLLTKEYMPYHAQVSQSSWAEIPTRLQAVILGMLKVVAAGLIALGIALSWLTLPLSRGESWATWAILSVVLVNGLITIYVTVTLRKVEPTAKTPVAAAASSVALVMVALLLANLA
jgi:hypothetical protein